LRDAEGIAGGVRAGAPEILACWKEARGEDAGPLIEGMGRLLGAFAEFLSDPEPLEGFGREGATRSLVREISALQHEAGRDAVGVMEDYAALRRCVWRYVEGGVDLGSKSGAEVARFFVKLMQAADWATEKALEEHDEISRRAMEILIVEAEATDLLTGLPDRDLFQSKLLPEALAAHDRAALIVFDLARFSETLASAGAAQARTFLVRLADIVGEAAPGGAVRVRFGDDEIAALIPGATAEEAYAVAERAMALLVEGTEGIQADAGVAAYPGHADDAGGLVAAAVGALSTAKRVGGSGIVIAH
jgi:diguanylate cyclase (GGDEF)-like protein